MYSSGQPYSAGEILERQQQSGDGGGDDGSNDCTAAIDGGDCGTNHGRRMAGRPEPTWTPRTLIC